MLPAAPTNLKGMERNAPHTHGYRKSCLVAFLISLVVISLHGDRVFTFMLEKTVVAALNPSLTGEAFDPHSSFNYTTVTGFFLQDDPSTNASSFNFTSTNFGLINRTYPAMSKVDSNRTQWQRFSTHLSTLQHQAPDNVRYKLLLMGRHGEGYHNAAEAFYGTPAWNCFYSILNGNGTVTWADPTLTPKGIQQASALNKYWASEIEIQKIPIPQSFYVSPLTRCLETAALTFRDLEDIDPFTVVVKEFLREGVSGHTCDRRRSRTYIHKTFPDYKVEESFSEDDPLFVPLFQETQGGQDARSRVVLDDIFSQDSSTFISITSHSGEIASLLRVLGHREFALSTGAVIPVLVKAVLSQCEPPITSEEPYTGICTCTAPPPKTATSSECTTATATIAPPGGEPI